MIQLIVGIWNSDDSNFLAGIYNQYKQLMFSTARKYTTNTSDQEDIVQTTMVRLIKIFGGLPPSKCCISASYIVYSVRSVAIDFLRKQGTEEAHFIDADDEYLSQLAEPSESLDDALSISEDAARLKVALLKLAVEDRMLLRGKYIFGQTDKELATILQCRPSSIRMKLTRARQMAKKLLQEMEEL